MEIKEKLVTGDLKCIKSLIINRNNNEISPYSWCSIKEINWNGNNPSKINFLVLGLTTGNCCTCILHGFMRIIGLECNLKTGGDSELQEKLINSFKKFTKLNSIDFKTEKQDYENIDGDDFFDGSLNTTKKRIGYLTGDQVECIIFNFYDIFSVFEDENFLVLMFFIKILYIMTHQNHVSFYKKKKNLFRIKMVLETVIHLMNNQFKKNYSHYLFLFNENLVEFILKLNELDLTLLDVDQSVVENKIKNCKKNIGEL